MTEARAGARLPAFDRRFFSSDALASRIGQGGIGGKAAGLLRAEAILKGELDPAGFPGVDLRIPRMVVVTTEPFEDFLADPALRDVAASGAPDDRIANAFLRAPMPPAILGDLRALVEGVRQPLAVRSSSLLEDRLREPFAGVYVTKMIPNSDPDPDVRFRKLTEAIKLVWASAFFREARDYARATSSPADEERMAVVVQEVVGRRHQDRFYPELSGVGRSYNFYPFGRATREEGVVSLALGLGKRIVDGEVSWTYSPRQPRTPPPFGSLKDRAKSSQLDFWAVDMSGTASYDPVHESEHLIRASVVDAEYDGTLRYVASTYDPASDRITPGVARPGPRVVDFAPLLMLGELPVNDLLCEVLDACRDGSGEDVEIEFAATFEERPEPRANLRFLQMRPMVVSSAQVDVSDEEMAGPALVASEPVLGNGELDTIRDVVYLRPDRFDRAHTREIAREVERINEELASQGREYLLIGYGRWGTSDPWLGVPVAWAQIRGAKAIVEATLSDVVIDPSQGSHFFHNVTSFDVYYFYVREGEGGRLDWTWLESRPAETETRFVRHVRTEVPLVVKVDGRTGRGLVRVAGGKPGANPAGAAR